MIWFGLARALPNHYLLCRRSEYFGYDMGFIWFCPLIVFSYAAAFRVGPAFAFSPAGDCTALPAVRYPREAKLSARSLRPSPPHATQVGSVLLLRYVSYLRR